MFQVNREKHLVFYATLPLAMPPDTLSPKLVKETLANAHSYHPDLAKVDWSAAEWLFDNEPLEPNFGVTLVENGIEHRTSLRFTTPGLDGIAG